VIPAGAQEIHDLRVAGKRPSEFVVCSTIGQLPFRWLVDVDLTSDWDLLWAIDLDVVVAAQSTDSIEQLLFQFRRHRPKTLVLWLDDIAGGYDVKFFPEHETIKLPIDQWVWKIDMLPMRSWENLAMLELMTGETA
jgi:hypothetical protein